MANPPPIIGYCTNVHAANSLELTLENLSRYPAAVREELEDRELGVGLWLPETVVGELEDDVRLGRFRSELEALGLFVFTINGFPQGDFHAEVVKGEVYRPDWRDRRRLDHTLRLARLLADIAPGRIDSLSISTLPIGWRASVDSIEPAVDHLVEAARGLRELESRTGRLVHVDLEPEPGCCLDRARDVVGLFERLPDFARRYLRVCHDICHSAVMFEDQAEVIGTYREAGIGIGKVQVSSCPEGRVVAGDRAVERALADFAEPRYLHQSVLRSDDGTCTFFEDLPRLLERGIGTGTVRVHFHVPLFVEALGPLGTTQSEILEFIRACPDGLPPLEVETYAWNVLPEAYAPPGLARGIAEELRWLRRLVEQEGYGTTG